MADQAAQFKAKGNEFFKAKDYATAIEWYSKAVDADPQNRVYYSNRAAAYTAMKNYEAAAADGKSCVACDPSWNKGYFRYATALQGLKRYQEALKIVNQGLAKMEDKSLTTLRETLAPLAERERKQAMSNMASNARLKEEGNAFFKGREFQKAVDKYQAAIDDPNTKPGDPIHISSYNNMAGAYQQLHNHRGVVEASSMVLEHDENNQKALLRRGLAFEGLERFQLGLTDIRKLLLLNPNIQMANKAQHRLQNSLRQQRKMKGK